MSSFLVIAVRSSLVSVFIFVLVDFVVIVADVEVVTIHVHKR